jgi:hypothetical protein
MDERKMLRMNFALTPNERANLMKRGAILAILPPLTEGQAEQLRQKKSLCQQPNHETKNEHAKEK